MLKSVVGRLRLTGMLEALSYLLLLGVAMPLKYIWHKEIYVEYCGLAHGVLFILYCLALLHAKLALRLSFKYSVVLFVAALVPFGPFVADRKLRDLEKVR
tara:strand:- start:159 stop:458 length:300 start_codon:yes stop_codon:yes gene_type:complete